MSRPRLSAADLVGYEKLVNGDRPQRVVSEAGSFALPEGMLEPEEPDGSNGADVPRGTSRGFEVGSRLRVVPLDSIDPNPRQPRQRWDSASLESLAVSIGERGILQPPVVREVGDRYQLVAGERRQRAAKLAGLTEIEVLVGDQNDVTALQDALMENVDREDLTPIETARAYLSLTRDLGITHEILADRVGADRTTVTNYIRLLDLPDSAIELIDKGALSFAHGRELAGCADHAERGRLAALAVEKHWSSRQLGIVIKAAKTRVTNRGATADYDQAIDGMALADRGADGLSRRSGMEWKGALLKDGRVKITVKGTGELTARDPAKMRDLLLGLGVPADELTT